MATLTLRATKGSPLTNTEADSNFQNLNNALGASGSATIPTPTGTGGPVLSSAPTVANMTYSGSLKGTGNVNIGANSASAVTLSISGTDAVLLPKGTVAQRPTGVSGYLRFNSDYSLYEGYDGTAWTRLGGAQGGSGNSVFFENDITVAANYTISTNKNAMTAGPITVNSGVVVTVPVGSVWTIV